MQTKTVKLLKVECEPACGFIIRSQNEDEVARTAREHVLGHHGKDVTLAEARGFIQPA